VAAALLYFAIVYACAFVTGAVRVLWVEPLLGGRAIPVLIETPLLLAAMVLGARRAVRSTGIADAPGARVAMGVVALVLQQLADLALGVLLRGMTAREVFGQFRSRAGIVYAAALAAYALMPLAVGRAIGPAANARAR
jgi:hypothetical protein